MEKEGKVRNRVEWGGIVKRIGKERMELVGREWNRVKGRLLWELMESVTLATNCIPWKQLLSGLPRVQGLAGSLATGRGLENSGPKGHQGYRRSQGSRIKPRLTVGLRQVV
jgi:hypothetical protein